VPGQLAALVEVRRLLAPLAALQLLGPAARLGLVGHHRPRLGRVAVPVDLPLPRRLHRHPGLVRLRRLALVGHV
jgi:hypothetical protein